MCQGAQFSRDCQFGRFRRRIPIGYLEAWLARLSTKHASYWLQITFCHEGLWEEISSGEYLNQDSLTMSCDSVEC